MRQIAVGQRLPSLKLARMSGEEVQFVDLDKLLLGRRVVLVGLPGAFTPVCTNQHLPALVKNASRLAASGFNEIICVAPNSPWVVREWASQADPGGLLTFLSDGNLQLARAVGFTHWAPEFYLGECCRRFSMILRSGVVERLNVEERIELITCTDPEKLVA